MKEEFRREQLTVISVKNASISELNIDDFSLFPYAQTFKFQNNPIKKIVGTSMGKNFDQVFEIFLGGGENRTLEIEDGCFDGMFRLGVLDLNRTETLWYVMKLHCLESYTKPQLFKKNYFDCFIPSESDIYSLHQGPRGGEISAPPLK